MAYARALPTRNGDGAGIVTPSRTDPYGGAYNTQIGSSNWALADEGSYYIGTNATVGTGIAGHAAPVVADTDTKALLHLFNGTTTGKKVTLDFLFMEVTAAGTAGTLHYTVVYVDNKGSTALTSGGTTITPVPTLSDGIATDSGIILTFGACATTMTSSKKLGTQLVREVIPVVQDTMLIKFGAPNGGIHAGLTTASTATTHTIQHFPPVTISPGGNLNIAQIRASQSAASSYQFTFGYWVR